MIHFFVYGHRNTLGTHKNTLEFTKDSELTLKGDCIVGVKADFDLDEIKELIRNNKNNKIIIKIISSSVSESIKAELNPDFKSDKELVIRKTDFLSDRTFAINADKAAVDIDREIIETLKKPSEKIEIIIEKQ